MPPLSLSTITIDILDHIVAVDHPSISEGVVEAATTTTIAVLLSHRGLILPLIQARTMLACRSDQMEPRNLRRNLNDPLWAEEGIMDYHTVETFLAYHPSTCHNYALLITFYHLMHSFSFFYL